MRKFMDIETGDMVDEMDLLREYWDNKDEIRASSGAESFEEFLLNSTSKDGFLVEIHKRKPFDMNIIEYTNHLTEDCGYSEGVAMRMAADMFGFNGPETDEIAYTNYLLGDYEEG